MIGRLITGLAVAVAVAAGVVALAVLPAHLTQDLTALTGELNRCETGICIGDRLVNFGEPSYLQSELSTVDHDRDGTIGTRSAEIDGLLGRQVTVEFDPNGNVVTLNGYPWGPATSTSNPGTSSTIPGPTTTTRPGGPSTTTTLEDNVVTGVLQRCDPWICVGGSQVYFGPWWYLTSSEAPVDLNGDGALGLAIEELDSLVGSIAEVEVKVEDGQLAAIRINGLTWRSSDGQPPWTGGPPFGSDQDED